MATVVVSGLPPTVAEGNLYELFTNAQFIHLCRERGSGNSLGYALITYTGAEEAVNAVEILDETPMEDQPITVQLAKMCINGEILLYNIPQHTTKKDLEHYFAKFGSIIRCDVTVEDGMGKGFVEFDSSESATVVKTLLDNMIWDGLKIIVHNARPKKSFVVKLSLYDVLEVVIAMCVIIFESIARHANSAWKKLHVKVGDSNGDAVRNFQLYCAQITICLSFSTMLVTAFRFYGPHASKKTIWSVLIHFCCGFGSLVIGTKEMYFVEINNDVVRWYGLFIAWCILAILVAKVLIHAFIEYKKVLWN